MNNNQAKHNSKIGLAAVDTAASKIINPSPELRIMQREIYNWLRSQAKPSIYSFFGYSHAVQDLDLFKSRYSYIHLDLESCYEKITYSRIVGLFRQLGNPYPIYYAKYCTYNGTLMRGGIPSNYILELILRRLDYRLHGYAKICGFKYHRYVDDLYFFGDLSLIYPKNLVSCVTLYVEEEGFKINKNKTEIIKR